jgi:hypothetical protein
MSPAALLDEGIAAGHSELETTVSREGRVSMMRKWIAIPLAVLAMMVVATSASAQQVRSAKIGDRARREQRRPPGVVRHGRAGCRLRSISCSASS